MTCHLASHPPVSQDSTVRPLLASVTDSNLLAFASDSAPGLTPNGPCWGPSGAAQCGDHRVLLASRPCYLSPWYHP